MKQRTILLSLLLAAVCCHLSAGVGGYVLSWEKTGDALHIETTAGRLTLRPYDFGALGVSLYPSETKQEKSYAVVEEFPGADFSVDEDAENLTLKSKYIKVVLRKSTGQLDYYDTKNLLLISQTASEWDDSPEKTTSPRATFSLSKGDALYGLGQFRDKALNLRGVKRELVQFNTQAAVPVIYSSGGWGLLWDNPSRTLFEDGLEGMHLASDEGNGVNYYLLVGSSLDELVGAYRTLTGPVPMLPYWALGFHQSRNKYATRDELLGVAGRMRDESIRMSSIFIDYFYWGKYGTGSHRFDESLFPEPAEMLKTLREEYDTRTVITLWPTFNPGTEHYKELASKGFLLEGAKALDGTIYDVFNPEARELYWQQVLPLVNLGIDGWFLDGPEPDQPAGFLGTTTWAGPAREVRNLYPLLHAENFYKHITALRPDRRPYLLTRCAWAGQQRAGTAVWSGDIPTTFDELETQVTAGLNFVATGIPYWTTDIGGYSGGDPASEEYRELFTRWFQYGTFCPVFRSHGRRFPGDTKAPNELWAYGDDVQRICSDYIDLRYTLMPYIYTLSGDATHKNRTPMRLLAFDFSEDEAALDCKDQFMYGPSLLVCPVLKAGARQREVYLPKGSRWIDFRTGDRYEGGERITAPAPIESIPLFVKSGAIIPTYTDSDKNNSPDSPVKISIYGGSNGKFELYKDDGDSFGYLEGDYAYIPFSWNDNSKKLTIGAQRGDYRKGAPQQFTILVAGEEGEKTITYRGKKMTVKL